MARGKVSILGVFVADLTFRADRLPNIGETFMGNQFALGPGGKGSNQAVAAARSGAEVSMIAKLGDDTFGSICRDTWKEAGVADCSVPSEIPTGSAMVYVNDVTGDNAIILVPGSGGSITPDEIAQRAEVIKSSDVFVTQLEQPHDSALAALRIANEANVTTVFNPAPAPEPIDEEFLTLSDFITPNESEAEGLTGIKVDMVESARKAGDALLAKGVGCAILTLGEKGALVHSKDLSELVPSNSPGDVLETTGAGDAFNGTFAAALAEGQGLMDAVRFACAGAGISVTRPGTSNSMPTRSEIDSLLAG